MVRKTTSQTTSVVEQTRRKAGVLSVTHSSPGILSKFFCTNFFIIFIIFKIQSKLKRNTEIGHKGQKCP